jgi:O-antigen/teichoic acid export membrane protein
LEERTSGEQPRPRLAVSATSNWAALAVNVLVGLLLTPYLISKLGKAGFGTWSLVWSLIGYYGLLRMGVGSGIMRYLPFYEGRGDHKAASETVSTGLAIYFFVGVVIFISAFLLSWPIADFYKGGAILATLICLTGLSAALDCPRMIFDAGLRAQEKWVAANSVTVAASMFHGGGLAAILYLGYGLVQMGYVVLAETGIFLVIITLIFISVCKKIHLKPSMVKFVRSRELVSFGFFTTVVTLGYSLSLQTHRLIIGKIVSLEAVGVYAVAAVLIERVRQFVWAPLQVSWPRFALLDGQGNRKELTQLFIRLTRYSTFLASGVVLLVLVSGPPFIELWVGKGFEAAQMVLLVLGVSCLIESSLLITTSLLGSTGHQKTQAVFAAVEGALGVVLSILMAQTMGLQGVVIGYSISVILIRGLICPWYVCRLLGIDVIKYYIDCLARPWLITGLLAILVHLSGLLAYTNSWVPLIVLTAVAACAFIALAWIIAMNQQEKSEVLGFIRMNILRLRLGKEIV